MPGRGSSRPAGAAIPLPAMSSPRSQVGRCSIAYASWPSGPGTGSGKYTTSLLVNRFRSASSSGWYSKWIGPRRRQLRRSPDTARAGLGPSGPKAT